MKKSLIIVSALASTFALVAAPVVVPALGMSAFAAEGETAETNATLEKVTKLLDEVKKKVPTIDQWTIVRNLMYAMEHNYACMGKGCTADELGLLRNDTIAIELANAGRNTENMTSLEKIEAAKKLDKYSSDAEFKNIVDNAANDYDGMIFGYEDDGGYNLVSNLPADFDTEAIKSMTPAEILAKIKAIPHYKDYEDLAMKYQQLSMASADTDPEQVETDYNRLVSALAVVEELQAPQTPSTPEQTESINELEKFIQEVTEDPTYQKYERLVYQTRYAEDLLAAMRDPSIDLGGKGGDDAGVPTAQAETNSEADYGKEAAEAIKAIGDAMRAIGIKTELGNGLTTATADELEAALKQAKGVDKFQEYSDLVDAVEAAAAALANGSTDVTELKKALENIKTAVKVLVPDTGVAASSSVDADAAIETTSLVILLATIAVLVDVAIIAKRSFARKNH